MDRGYDSTSISVLQTELNMSRGAMYRYFSNKEELFHAVIDEYFFRLFDKLLSNVDENLTLAQLIEIVYRRQRLTLNVFTRAGVTHTFFLNYTALMIQAAKHYPGFLEHFKDINNRMTENWRKALVNSINAGEVRSDINIEIMSILFNNVSVKESSDRNPEKSSFTTNILKDMEKRKEVVDYLYSLIKI